MLKILIAVAILNIVGVSVLKAEESFFQQDDKVMHMGFSVFVGMAGTAICKRELGFTSAQSWWCGLGSALIVGAIKEGMDDKFDWEDMGADAIGGAIGSTGMYVIYEW